MNSCLKHQRDLTIYDLELNRSICDRCALFDPTFKPHTFIEVKQLGSHSENIFKDFTNKVNALQLYEQNSQVTSRILQQMSLKKIQTEVSSITKSYGEMIKELEIQRDSKINQAQKAINLIVEQSNKSINFVVYKQYKKVAKAKQDLKKLLEQKKYSQLCQTIKNILEDKRLQLIQKDLQMIYFQFNNKIKYVGNQPPYFLPLFKKISQKEQMLLNPLEIETATTIDSLKQSRVSAQSDRTSISFGSVKSKNQKSIQLNGKIDVSLKNTLNTLKVHNKSQIKNLYIKNSIKTITMSKLDMNNNQALQAIKKCSSNNFVSKIDLSCNQITERFIVHLKRQKIQSKYLKTIVIKDLKLDTRQLKKQGIQLDNAKRSITVGNIKIEY